MSSDTTAPTDSGANDYTAVPDDLRDPDKWVCWRREDRDGDATKVPVDPSTGDYASATDPDTWASFDRARDVAATRDDVDGIGFVFTDDDTVAGIDVDDCRDAETGSPSDVARDIIDRLDSYTEVSPSGTGYHVYVHGVIPDGRHRHDGVELYDDARFFTVTGDHADVTPSTVEARPDELRAVHDDYVARDDADDGPTSDTPDPTGDGTHGGVDGLSDTELIDRATAAEDGDKFERLWNGRTTGYDSHSEADAALCALLAFWTGGDRRRIERLFGKSGLVRDKWRDRPDYRERTIDFVLQHVGDTYDPDAGNDPDVPTDLSVTVTPPDPDRDGGIDVTLCPAEVAAWAGLGEDEGVSDLNDRQKAASAWALLKESDRYHVRVRRDNGSLWAYDDGVWKPTGERALRHAGRQAVGDMNFGSNVVSELEAQARGDPTVEVNADDFGLDPGFIAVKNGLVNLEAAADGAGDDTLRPLRPDDYALTRLPVEYDPNAGYDRWADYVDEWAEDGRADALQEYVGYCLHVGAMPIHRALLLVGSGANGKGTFLSVVRALLGDDNTTSIELQTLANEKDAVADFYGSLANIDDDLSARKLGNGIGMFKKLVGGDRVRARHLYEDGFEFRATGKHLYAANEVPNVNVPDDDEAFWRRWVLVEFPNHYPPSQRDPTLRDELTAPDVLSGVLNWAIVAWDRLLEQGYFTDEDRLPHTKRERWQAWGESVDTFISECVDRDTDADRITTTDAHRRYAAWCREHGHDPVGQRKFTNKLKQEDVGYKTGVRIDGTSKRGYKALGLSDDVPAVDDTPERTTPDGTRQEQL